MIDVAKLARQDQPPPAYGNADENLPSNVSHLTRATRPLPTPSLDRHSSGVGTHLANPVLDISPAESYETSNPAAQSCTIPSSSAPSYSNSVLPTRRQSSGDASEPSVGSSGKSQPHDPLDWIDRNSTTIFPLPTRISSNTSSCMGPSDQHSTPSDSIDRDSSWMQNTPPTETQHVGSTTAVSPRPVSSGSVQTWSSLPPPYSPPEVSSSRNSRRPFSEPIPNLGITSPSPPAAPALASRNLPPPAPPTILDPPPVRSSATRNSRAPHEPFLSDAPPPADSWIAVETSPGEYRLIARLPGYRRDAMYVTSFMTSGYSLMQRNRYCFLAFFSLLQYLSCEETARVARCC